MRSLKGPAARFARFLAAGVVNTGITYLIYLALLPRTSYGLSYTVAYVAGIVLSFLLNRFFVFDDHRGARSVLLFPLVYVAQYAVGILVLWIWVDVLGLSREWGPLIVIVVSVPLTYVLSRWVFVRPAGDVAAAAKAGGAAG